MKRLLLLLAVSGLASAAFSTSASTARGQTILRSDVYGAAWNFDGLSNMRIATRSGTEASIRFKAIRTGAFDGVRVYFVFATPQERPACPDAQSCYGGGTGGTLKVELRKDDGTAKHVPTNVVLASTVVTDPMRLYPDQLSEMRDIRDFGAAPTLTSGQIYHLVFFNTHPDPGNNYVSLDHLDIPTTVNMQPGISDSALASLACCSPGWKVRSETPIYQVHYEDGASQGMGYMETEVSSAQALYGSRMAREYLTPASDETVSRVSVRLKRQGNPAPLTVRLESAAGTLIEEGSIPASAFSTRAHTWGSYMFTAPHTLAKGQKYHLVLSTKGSIGNNYEIYPIQGRK